MNAVLWWLQGFLCCAYLVHAAVHAFPPAALRRRLAAENRPRLRLTANVTEALGAAGLVLPGLLGVATWLTPVSAAGLFLLMCGAMAFHVSRREHAPATLPAVLAVGLAFLAYERGIAHPLN
ncbi:DoxX family protein [Nonomuraea jiangxiensis]|uniref:DoxX-like family protein n=1 Tax=Nonomuraea jiangxiensis TaxID=633440 RepID=A0A1G9R2E8_9ACTN|nr:DoxX family protein [Nonomuraea jiangxiensis]SDM17393.1 DoxX-like family protein [Nonomuraea jiangxiensis]